MEEQLTEREVFLLLDAVMMASEQVKKCRAGGTLIGIQALVEKAIQDLGLIQDLEQYAIDQDEAVKKLADNPCLYGGE